MIRTRFVDDLAPGDRISIDGVHRVVRTTSRLGEDQCRVEVVAGADDVHEFVLATNAKIEVV